MSMNAAMLGFVEFLRSSDGLSLTDTTCDEQVEGQPPPGAGQLYYAVHDEGSQNDETEFVGEVYGVSVTITVRTPWTPRDREAKNVRQHLRNLADGLKAIVIRGADLLRIQANTHIPSTLNGFTEPLRYKSTSAIRSRGPDWFWSDSEEGDQQSGASITVTFGGMTRQQGIDYYDTGSV